jgi:hypothetical protein
MGEHGEGNSACQTREAPREENELALILCSDCGKEMSDKAFSCPNCGNPAPPKPVGPPQPQSKGICVLLAIFAPMGIHRYVMGYNDIALAQLILSLLTCGIVTWVWCWIDVILILTGSLKMADGQELTG